MNVVIRQLVTGLKNGSRVAFLGVGSPLRADDSIGLYVVKELTARLTAPASGEFRFFLGESAPENFSGEIRHFQPTQLVIIDAADLKATPGTFRMIAREQIGGADFSTHMLPLKLLTDYLVMTTGCRVLIVGVQPQTLEFAQPLSAAVKQAADEFIGQFLAAWRQAT